VCVIGPSGSGKSTLLRCVNLLEQPTKGRIFILNEEITDLDADVDHLRTLMGMVFQSFNLFPHLTALENCTIALTQVLKKSPAEAKQIGLETLHKVGLGDRGDSYPLQMSGGQQQRVAIARALANDPQLVLADEPTGALDSHTSIEIMALLQALNREGITIVLVTHERDIAAFARRIILFRDGHVVEDKPNTPLDAAAALAETTA
jgi:polar amino acid transport system ATP-binding protein